MIPPGRLMLAALVVLLLLISVTPPMTKFLVSRGFITSMLSPLL